MFRCFLMRNRSKAKVQKILVQSQSRLLQSVSIAFDLLVIVLTPYYPCLFEFVFVKSFFLLGEV